MEQIIMLCVFAVAAAICIRAFVWSDQKSKYNETRSLAVISAQSAAETLKYYSGDLEKTAEKMGRESKIENGTLSVGFDGYSIVIRTQETSGNVGEAVVSADDGKGGEYVRFSVRWQEGGSSK